MGRNYIGKKKTYRLDNEVYREFQEWCKTKGLTVSKAIGLILTKAYLLDLLQDIEMRNLAVKLLNKQFERSVKRNE